jgi:hypothetical protein
MADAKNDNQLGKKIDKHVNNSYWHEKTHNNTATAYASGDAIGTVGTLQVMGDGGGGLNRRIHIVSSESVSPALRVWFFRRAIPDVTDDAAFAPTRETLRKAAGYVDFAAGDYESYGTLRFAQQPAANVDFSAPGGILYYVVEAQGAITYAAANAFDVIIGEWPD